MPETIILAGGCFWCLDAAYRGIRGVTTVQCGYAGGTTSHPTYEQVCAGTTGHAEVVQVTFDASKLPLETVLDVFFSIHDPTTLNRQGADVGTQYRSAIFLHNDGQEAQAQAAIRRAQAAWDDDIVTQVRPLEQFWLAEDYHQNYYANNPGNGYCAAVISPKLAKLRQSWQHLVVE